MGWNFKKENPGPFPLDVKVLLRPHSVCSSNILQEMLTVDTQQATNNHVMKYNTYLAYISIFDSKVFFIGTWFER